MDQRFPKSMRLLTAPQFEAVREARLVKHAGPLRVAGRPNGLPHSRIGLAVSRRVGGAVVRNRVKRMCREAFRLHRHDWPTGLDIVVIARPHEPAELDDYGRWLGEAMSKLSREAARRSGSQSNAVDRNAS